MEITAQVQKELELFNRGRTRDNGAYLISMATEYRPYYALWREFLSPPSYLFVRTLGVTLDVASARAFSMLQNCNVKLEMANNERFEPYYGNLDDLMPFGKYKGKHLAEIYYIDPSYMLWLANKFEPHNPRYERMVELAKRFAVVHFELTVRKPRIASVSRFVREVGDTLKDLQVTVLHVRLQVDTYKPDFFVDQNVLAADRDGNRFTFLVKARARSLSPNVLSCRSRAIEPQQFLHLLSAKVMSHYESHGVRYTRLGYVKLA